MIGGNVVFRVTRTYWLTLFLLSIGSLAFAEPEETTPAATKLYYDRDQGLVIQRGETDLWFGLRGQFRYNSSSTVLDTEDDKESRQESLEVNRARIKGGGKILRDWLGVYGEYDLKGSKWLDYRSTIQVSDWLNVRFGQWKSEFSRERFNSSGKQQLVERSISNYWFTLDRQRGLSTSARFGKGTRADVRIWVQALSGLGLNRAGEHDNGLLVGRLQWNPDGEELPFSGSDLKRRETPLRSVALAFVSGRSQCTRFSSDGCGQLPDYQEGHYDLDQLMFETALHYRGLGWEQELHFKKVRNKQTGSTTNMIGGYMQLGSFLNEWLPGVPAPLEIVGRLALVDPDTGAGSDLQQEWTLGANWFFDGHRNKLSLDLSWLDTESYFEGASQTRIRLQWEISL